MESTFTRHPEPVPNSETSWKDNLDYQEEYDKEWKGDSKFALPKRTSPYRFPRVPDYHDDEFDSTSADAFVRAKEQRYRERFIAIAEMKELQSELRACYAKNTVNAPRLCRPLAQEYLRRLRCPLYTCEPENRPVLVYSDSVKYGPKNSQVRPFYDGKEQPFESQ